MILCSSFNFLRYLFEANPTCLISWNHQSSVLIYSNVFLIIYFQYLRKSLESSSLPNQSRRLFVLVCNEGIKNNDTRPYGCLRKNHHKNSSCFANRNKMERKIDGLRNLKRSKSSKQKSTSKIDGGFDHIIGMIL